MHLHTYKLNEFVEKIKKMDGIYLEAKGKDGLDFYDHFSELASLFNQLSEQLEEKDKQLDKIAEEKAALEDVKERKKVIAEELRQSKISEKRKEENANFFELKAKQKEEEIAERIKEADRLIKINRKNHEKLTQAIKEKEALEAKLKGSEAKRELISQSKNLLNKRLEEVVNFNRELSIKNEELEKALDEILNKGEIILLSSSPVPVDGSSSDYFSPISPKENKPTRARGYSCSSVFNVGEKAVFAYKIEQLQKKLDIAEANLEQEKQEKEDLVKELKSRDNFAELYNKNTEWDDIRADITPAALNALRQVNQTLNQEAERNALIGKRDACPTAQELADVQASITALIAERDNKEKIIIRQLITNLELGISEDSKLEQVIQTLKFLLDKAPVESLRAKLNEANAMKDLKQQLVNGKETSNHYMSRLRQELTQAKSNNNQLITKHQTERAVLIVLLAVSLATIGSLTAKLRKKVR